MDILGLNISYDSSAALVRDGEVIAAIQEERFKRVKHYAGFPDEALAFCLKAGNTSLAEIDAVAFFWNPGIHAQVFNRRFSTQQRHHMEFLYAVLNNLIRFHGTDQVELMEQNVRFASGKNLRIYFIPHHLCHAASALFRSPFAESAILTVDGYGERESAAIWKGAGTELKKVWSQDFPHSLGSFYAAFTEYLGFKPNSGEGKMMGLASYGQPERYEEIRKLLTLNQNGFEIDLSYFSFFLERERRYTKKLVDLLGEERKPEGKIAARHENIANSAQKALEDGVLHLAGMAKNLTGSRNLSMAGGVTLNCLANSRVIKSGLFKRHFFMPASSDAGAAMGAALYVCHCLNGKPREVKMGFDYLGCGYDNAAIEKELKKGGMKYYKPSNPAGAAAEMLAAGYIGSVFRGKAEFGPRALGNRSTISDPRPAAMKDRLNAEVKFREPFRPFAPSVLVEKMNGYFEGVEESPFMLRVYRTRKEKLKEAEAVTHVDGGARVQSVSREQNPFYYELISHFEKTTGTPLILNTSFNIRGEPIVNTPMDALKCYFTTGMSFLLIGDFMLVKDDALKKFSG